MKRARPGIASANRPRLGSFSTLMDQILDDGGALDGLAFAYAGLDPKERQALMRAVLQDADDPTGALLAFLTVEEDPQLQRRLASLVSRHGRVHRRALLEGNEGAGTADFIQSLPGLEPEVLHVAWKGCEVQDIRVEPRTDVMLVAEEDDAQVARAVQTVTPLLWQHIRSGAALPPGVERFAGFFSLR